MILGAGSMRPQKMGIKPAMDRHERVIILGVRGQRRRDHNRGI